MSVSNVSEIIDTENPNTDTSKYIWHSLYFINWIKKLSNYINSKIES